MVPRKRRQTHPGRDIWQGDDEFQVIFSSSSRRSWKSSSNSSPVTSRIKQMATTQTKAARNNGTFSTPSLFVRRVSCDEETVKIFCHAHHQTDVPSEDQDTRTSRGGSRESETDLSHKAWTRLVVVMPLTTNANENEDSAPRKSVGRTSIGRRGPRGTSLGN